MWSSQTGYQIGPESNNIAQNTHKIHVQVNLLEKNVLARLHLPWSFLKDDEMASNIQ